MYFSQFFFFKSVIEKNICSGLVTKVRKLPVFLLNNCGGCHKGKKTIHTNFCNFLQKNIQGVQESMNAYGTCKICLFKNKSECSPVIIKGGGEVF